MGTLFLIRHGQASYGDPDYDRLSPTGIEQARALGKVLAAGKLDAIFIGPHVRHRQTYEHATAGAGDHALPVATELPGLAEYPAFDLLKHLVPRLVAEDAKFAALASAPTAKLLDEAFRTILGRWGGGAWDAPGVEHVDDFVARVRSSLHHLTHTSHYGARIGVVTSAGPIGVALGLAMGSSADRMIRASITVRNASITQLKFRRDQPDQLSLATFNETSHLPLELVSNR